MLADRAVRLDPLGERLDLDGFELPARDRANRTKPPTDGRKSRRPERRWAVERTFAWMKNFRRVATLYERWCDLNDGFVSLAGAFIALARL